MNDDLVFRKAKFRDVETVVRMANTGGPDGNPRRELPLVLPNTYFEAFDIIDCDPNQFLMVAELRGEIVGTFHLSLITYLAGEGRPDVQVEAIHVRAGDRGKGIGTKMLQWVIQFGQDRNCRRIQLTTDKKRVEAHSLYRRLGFVFSHEGVKLVF